MFFSSDEEEAVHGDLAKTQQGLIQASGASAPIRSEDDQAESSAQSGDQQGQAPTFGRPTQGPLITGSGGGSNVGPRFGNDQLENAEAGTPSSSSPALKVAPPRAAFLSGSEEDEDAGSDDSNSSQHFEDSQARQTSPGRLQASPKEAQSAVSAESSLLEPAGQSSPGSHRSPAASPKKHQQDIVAESSLLEASAPPLPGSMTEIQLRSEITSLRAQLEEIQKSQAKEREELERLRTSDQLAQKGSEELRVQNSKLAEDVRILELSKSQFERSLQEDRKRHKAAMDMLQEVVANAEAEQKYQAEEQKKVTKRLEEQLQQRDARWRTEVQRLWLEVTGHVAPTFPT